MSTALARRFRDRPLHFRGGGWYLKLTVDEETPEVAIISFHPLEAPLRTNRGEVKP
jgi:hypothetical protein